MRDRPVPGVFVHRPNAQVQVRGYFFSRMPAVAVLHTGSK